MLDFTRECDFYSNHITLYSSYNTGVVANIYKDYNDDQVKIAVVKANSDNSKIIVEYVNSVKVTKEDKINVDHVVAEFYNFVRR